MFSTFSTFNSNIIIKQPKVSYALSSVNNNVLAICLDISKNNVYAGGSFTTANNGKLSTPNNLAYYNTTDNNWNVLPSTSINTVYQLLFINNILYVAANNGFYIFNIGTQLWTIFSVGIVRCIGYNSSLNMIYLGGYSGGLIYSGLTTSCLFVYNISENNLSNLTNYPTTLNIYTILVDNPRQRIFTTAFNSNPTIYFDLIRLVNINIFTTTLNRTSHACFDLSYNIYVAGERISSVTDISGIVTTCNQSFFYNTYTNAVSNFNSYSTATNSDMGALCFDKNGKIYFGGWANQTVWGTFTTPIGKYWYQEYVPKTNTWSIRNSTDANNAPTCVTVDNTNNLVYIGGIFTTAPGGGAKPYITVLPLI